MLKVIKIFVKTLKGKKISPDVDKSAVLTL